MFTRICKYLSFGSIAILILYMDCMNMHVLSLVIQLLVLIIFIKLCNMLKC